MLRLAPLCLLYAILLSPASAQVPDAPRFRQIGIEQGLPSNRVHHVAQDREGYVWAATFDGLARYDGMRFQVWQHDPLQPESLPANTLQALHIDAAERIWVGSEGGGLSLLREDRRGFRTFRPATDPRFVLDDVWSITSSADGALWFGGYGGGVFRYDVGRDELTRWTHDPENPGTPASDHVLAIAAGAADVVWVGTSKGLDRLQDGRFERVPLGSDPALAAPVITSLSVDPDGSLWIGTQRGLFRRLPEGSIEDIGAIEAGAIGAVTAVRADERGGRWFASRRGIFHRRDGNLQRLAGVVRGSETADEVVAYDALVDHEGGIWFATLGAGLLRLPPQWRNFAVRTQGLAERGGLSSAAPRGIAEGHEGGLWVIGARGALDRIDARGLVQRKLDPARPVPGEPWALLDGPVALWIGHSGGLSRLDHRSGELHHWLRTASEDPTPDGLVDLLLPAPDGGLWLASNGAGLQRRDAEGRVRANWAPGAESGLPDGDIDAIAWGPDQRLWVATGGGLVCFDADAQRFLPRPGLPAERIYGFDFAADGTLWLQRLSALEHYRLRPDGADLLRRIDASRGLPAVEAGGLVLDRLGQVWITSRRGLFRYREERDDLRRYGVRDGLPTPEFHNRPPLKLRDGRIAAATLDGLVIFDPNGIEEDRRAPRLRIEAIEVRRAGRVLALDPRAPLELRHDDRELRISARLLSFADPQSHRYRFRLDGWEPDWIDAGASGERVFSQLPPGRYRLDARARNADGAESAPITLALHVAPPWWIAPWAWATYLLGLLAVAAAAAGVARARLRRRHAAQLAEQQRAWALRASEAKSTFLATLGHEIRTPMTGVLGMTELLLRTPLVEQQRGYAEAIRRSGELLLRLVNDALDLARIESGRLELADAGFDLHAVFEDVAALQRPLAARKDLEYALRIAPEAPRRVRGDALRVKQILLNLGGNAIKFTERGGVALALEAPEAGHAVVFSVRDSGPGLDAQQQARLFQRFSQAEGLETSRRYGGSGLGLAICRELAAAMHGDIAVESVLGEGSVFRVRLPLATETEPEAAMPQAVPADAAASRSATSASTASRRILLVEDDATIAEVVVGLLRAAGHEVEHAGHGLAALTALAQSRFDLAFVDLDLPGVSGLELAGLIRAQGHRLPLVALTARADPEAEPQARAADMADFLRKPVSGAQLAAVVARWGQAARTP